MSVFVMADTHLSLSCDKPMDVFGSRWAGYTEKIRGRWRETVRDDDTVVIPGDLSWGIDLDGAREDLRFINDLPGEKFLLKGNHDYWWNTLSKMTAFCEENGFSRFHFLHNGAYRAEDFILCGSRGWYTEDKKVVSSCDIDTKKIVAREVGRLKTSLDAGKKLHDEILAHEGKDLEMLVFLHFPPYFRGYICDEIILELYRYGIARCYFGHIHGAYDVPAVREYMDIEFSLISADFLDFRPLRIDKR